MIILKVQKDQSELKKDMDLNSNMIILKDNSSQAEWYIPCPFKFQYDNT
ncbi:hypothetical protein FUSPEROL_00603 [Fusobacterium periodonticum ATCC 33693]|uniref:Uncharacterized protein n=1 Tax=Fusobacterium periodonticum ATCC 33693 TaxID=546275 RepID=D4CT91_9FUSO|nr:hypothetical protein FUSPEROL_00603 [Fusobacterium periodonticum ATCC 33693]